MGWGTPIAPAAKPGPKEELERLKPLELPFLNMGKWKSQHPATDYLQPPHGWGSPGEVATKVAVTVGLEVLGHYVKVLHPIGWVHLGYEFLELLTSSEGRNEKALEAQRRAFNEYIWKTFWSDERFYPSASVREAALDTLIGDNANHGVAPRLTEEAELKRREIVYEINARWLADMEAMQEADKYVERYGPEVEATKALWQAEAAEARRNAELYVLMDPARSERERSRAEMFERWAAQQGPLDNNVNAARELSDSYKADMKRVLEFEANPANWNLTKEERALLPDKWQQMFAERDALEARQQTQSIPYRDPSNPGALVVQHDDALERFKEHMASEAVRCAPGPR